MKRSPAPVIEKNEIAVAVVLDGELVAGPAYGVSGAPVDRAAFAGIQLDRERGLAGFSMSTEISETRVEQEIGA